MLSFIEGHTVTEVVDARDVPVVAAPRYFDYPEAFSISPPSVTRWHHAGRTFFFPKIGHMVLSRWRPF
jgi:hypothetical protein